MRALKKGDSALGIIIEGEGAERINLFRKMYDVFFGTFPPHITISDIPFMGEMEWKLKKSVIEEKISCFSPFDIKFRSTGFFANGGYVLWLKPEDKGETDEIRRTLASVFPSYFNPDRDFRKHLTVGFFQREEELMKAKKFLDVSLGIVEFSAKKISFMLIDENGNFSEADHIEL
ncbi:2'-5' RNA ligase family protein [candidate division WOR-3 bacterium]|nr:2'-5' RNA ligase family protein [candidate division WOR-3 bacterium]